MLRKLKNLAGGPARELDSSRQWSTEAQRKFWNDWDLKHLQDSTLGQEALRRGEVVLNLALSLGLDRPRIAEIGCGNGWFTGRLQSMGETLGVDISDAAIEQARLRVPGAKFIAADIMSVNITGEHYDIVVSLETLSHVLDQQRFMHVAADLLCQHGYLILATQNRFVYTRRSNVAAPAEGQLRKWVGKRQLRKLLRPCFKCIQLFTIEPSGDLGCLGIVNSRKLNSILLRFFSEGTIRWAKEKLGLGQTIIALAQKR